MLNLLFAVAAFAAIPDTAPFTFDLYHEISAKPGNLFYSPYSLESALAMTSAGARGATQTEMQRALHLDVDPDGGMGELRAALMTTAKDAPALSIANRLWGKVGEAYEPAFLDITRKNYGAALTPLDFVANPEGARKEINAWVEKETHDKIRNLLPSGSITKATILVLTNAIYFKGAWAAPFKTDATKAQVFHAASGGVERPFMRQTKKFPYWESEDFQAVRLPYQNSDLAMTIFLPKHGKKLDPKQLTPDLLRSFRMGQAAHSVDLALPKFHIESELEAKPVLEKLGMKLPFTEKADFSGIRKPGTEPFFLSAVIHKAFIDVDEAGTEAAAATAVMMVGMAAVLKPSPPKIFVADHPFFFLIEDTKNNAVLFAGRVSQP